MKKLLLFALISVISITTYSALPPATDKTNNDKPIDIVFDNFGFDLLETIS